jgi:hypothetical protein
MDASTGPGHPDALIGRLGPVPYPRGGSDRASLRSPRRGLDGLVVEGGKGDGLS